MKILALVAVVGIFLLPASAALSDSKYQAKAMGEVELRSGPGWRYPVVGGLRDGARFKLRTCTKEHGWCLVVARSGEAIGWAAADNLSGVSAKAQVTPWEPQVNPFADRWPPRHKDKPAP